MQLMWSSLLNKYRLKEAKISLAKNAKKRNGLLAMVNNLIWDTNHNNVPVNICLFSFTDICVVSNNRF